MNTPNKIKSRLHHMLVFMEPYWEWVNCHMVNFFTHNLWHTYVPKDLQAEISDANCVIQCIETVFWLNDQNTISLKNEGPYIAFKKFLNEIRQHTLCNYSEILTTIENFETLLHIEKSSEHLNIHEFLTCKKQHEVKIMATLVDNMLKSSVHKCAIIVDAGSGKGYLSTRLALEYDYKVLGIDFSNTNTERSLQISQKLQKAWNTLKNKALNESGEKSATSKERKKSVNETSKQIFQLTNYKSTAQFITSDMNLSQLVEENFADITLPFSICLIGLHTCGNLSPTCLRAFHNEWQCRFVCNVGCCYHLLNEQYLYDEIFENKLIINREKGRDNGFPMSNYLKERGVRLGRNARMLASQSIERVLNGKKLTHRSLFYRALLEVLLSETCNDFEGKVSVGKIRKYNNFQEYISLALQKYPAVKIPLERIENVEKQYQNDRYLDLFYLLRMSFAPVMETLILLDRLLFLHELNYKQSYIIPLFDPIISPRRYAIVSLK